MQPALQSSLRLVQFLTLAHRLWQQFLAQLVSFAKR